MTFTEPLGWTCHVCGRWREDAMIAVHSREFTLGGLGVPLQQNVRYCADNVECARGALTIAFVPGAEFTGDDDA